MFTVVQSGTIALQFLIEHRLKRKLGHEIGQYVPRLGERAMSQSGRSLAVAVLY